MKSVKKIEFNTGIVHLQQETKDKNEMKSVKKIEFNTGIVLERSITPALEQLGEADCSMELYTEDGELPSDGDGTIEWFITYKHNSEEVVQHIGVWWENKRLTDYDGLFSLPTEAIKLMRECGVTVGKDFE